MITSLCGLLIMCGVVEYVVIMYVWDHGGRWSYQERGGGGGGQRIDFGHQKLSPRREDADAQKQLQRIGNEGMHAAWEKLSYVAQGKLVGGGGEGEKGRGNVGNNADDVFYDQRKDLLTRLDQKLGQINLMKPESKRHTDSHHDWPDNKDSHHDWPDNKDSHHDWPDNKEEVEKIEQQQVLDPKSGDENSNESRRVDGVVNSRRFRVMDLNSEFSNRQSEFTYSSQTEDLPYGPEILVEYDKTLFERPLSPEEMKGNNIMLTLRTIKSYHNKRLPLLFSTWLTKVNRSNVFLMTDERDSLWQRRVWNAGMCVVLHVCVCVCVWTCSYVWH